MHKTQFTFVFIAVAFIAKNPPTYHPNIALYGRLNRKIRTPCKYMNAEITNLPYVPIEPNIVGNNSFNIYHIHE